MNKGQEKERLFHASVRVGKSPAACASWDMQGNVNVPDPPGVVAPSSLGPRQRNRVEMLDNPLAPLLHFSQSGYASNRRYVEAGK